MYFRTARRFSDRDAVASQRKNNAAVGNTDERKCVVIVNAKMLFVLAFTAPDFGR